MNIETLREFVVLGKSLNYTQAAKLLYLDQSTLSRRIRALEDEVGAVLIRRTTRQVELTKAGRAFLEDTINVLRRYDEALERARDLDASEVPTVRVGGVLSGGASTQLLSYATAQILRKQLGVSVEVFKPHANTHDFTKLSNDDPVDRLRQGDIDLAFVYGCEDGDWSGMSHAFLLKDPFVLFVDECHPLAQREKIGLADIAPYTLRTSVFFDKNNARLAEVCHQHGFAPKMESKIIDSIEEWGFSRGEYDAFMFMESVAGSVPPREISGLVKLAFDEPDACYELWAVWRSNDDSPGIPIVLNTLNEVVALMGA